MANRNDFIFIKAKCLKRFNFIDVKTKDEIEEIQKERIGFYHLILEGVTGIVDQNDERYCIIDTEYNRIVNNLSVNDYGMDMVYIGEEEKDGTKQYDIRLFNFKYREKFNQDKSKSENDISRSTKFLEYISSSDKQDESKNSLVSKQINTIIDLLEGNYICNLTLHMVSNEAKGFEKDMDGYISLLEKNYNMSIENISLDEIVNYFNEKKTDRKSSFLVGNNDFLQFEVDEKSTKKSYNIKLSLLDLIRITSKDEKITNNYSYQDDNFVRGSKLDYSLLFDNVRGYLIKSKYNKNIINSLKNEHEKFFMFNNGITITAEKIEVSEVNSGKKYLFEIDNFQIVNGGQTIRSIYSFFEQCEEEEIVKLREAYILLRIFKVQKDDILKNQIAQYTNSQNAISDIHLKSIDPLQIQIEKYLAEYDILYTRKSGDLGYPEKDYKIRINIERLAQLLYSQKGFPDKASNQKAKLFQEFYNDIFYCENFNIENCRYIINLSEEITASYSKPEFNYKFYPQKSFYIIFILEFTTKKIDEAIYELENLIKSYDTGDEITESRKLIHKKFKEHVMNSLEIVLNQ